jgi:3-hydroxyacyl-CoA dehydrogenase
MGNQIGIVCARVVQTTMVDLSEELIQKGFSVIKSFLNSQVKKGKMKDEEMGEILSLLSTTTDLTKGLSDVDLVIEAVFEDRVVKKSCLKKWMASVQKKPF